MLMDYVKRSEKKRGKQRIILLIHCYNINFKYFIYNIFSSFNQSEIEMVLKYIKILLRTERSRHRITESQIGVVTPYTMQAQKIQKRCNFLNSWNR